MPSVGQKVVVLKRKKGKAKGVLVRKSKGVIVVEKDSNGNVIRVYRDKTGRYFRNVVGTKIVK